MKKWRCIVCEYVHQGWKPPSHCPICGVQADRFEEIAETNSGKADCHRPGLNNPVSQSK